MNKQDVLQACTVEGNVVKLPEGQLDRKLYQEVAKALELIGGKWKGGKIAGFVFPSDPTDLLKQIASGEKRNLKKEYQFFATPDHIADKMVEFASIELYHRILEPSAGQGAIVDAICRRWPSRKHSQKVTAFELMEVNRSILEKKENCHVVEFDFLNTETDWSNTFHRIIANPPFSKNQDIDHVRKMYDCLKVGGRMVTIMSTHWIDSKNKKETEFRDWLGELNHRIEFLDKGEFKESGTNVPTVMVIIDK